MPVASTPLKSTVEALRGPYRPCLSILLGIVAPLACITIQFTLFRDLVFELPGLRFLNLYPLLNYGIVAVEMFKLALWVARGENIGRWCGLGSGILLAGSLFAGLLGLVLLPFSVIGLIVWDRHPGLRPARHGVRLRSQRNSCPGQRGGKDRPGSRLGVRGARRHARHRVTQRRAGGVVVVDPNDRERHRQGDPGVRERLRRIPAVLYQDHLALLYVDERDPVRQQRLADAYRKLCRGEIESRLIGLRD